MTPQPGFYRATTQEGVNAIATGWNGVEVFIHKDGSVSLTRTMAGLMQATFMIGRLASEGDRHYLEVRKTPEMEAVDLLPVVIEAGRRSLEVTGRGSLKLWPTRDSGAVALERVTSR